MTKIKEFTIALITILAMTFILGGMLYCFNMNEPQEELKQPVQQTVNASILYQGEE